MIKATGEGRLGQDPKLSYTPSGMALLKLNVASNTGFGDKKKTSWIAINIWGKRGESLNPLLQKGSHIFFSGTFELHEYEKDGVKKSFPQINADEIVLLGGHKPKESLPSEEEMQNLKGDAGGPPASTTWTEMDIPF